MSQHVTVLLEWIVFVVSVMVLTPVFVGVVLTASDRRRQRAMVMQAYLFREHGSHR